MRIQKPKSNTVPKPVAGAKHPMALSGMRWLPSMALHPANLLQLQQSAGNGAVAEWLRLMQQTSGDGAPSWTAYRAARKDGIVSPPPGTRSEDIMERQDPRMGDWNIQFVADNDSRRTIVYWITL